MGVRLAISFAGRSRKIDVRSLAAKCNIAASSTRPYGPRASVVLAAWISARALALSVSVAPSANVSWDAPEVCPSQADFERALEGKLGRPLSSIDDAVRVVVHVAPIATGFEAKIWWVVPEQPIGARRFEAARCDTVAEAAAEVVAIAAVPALEEIEARVAAPVVVASAPPEPCPDIAPAPAVVDDVPERRLRFGVSALGGVGLGETPQAGGILRARASLLGRVWRVDAQAHYRFERRARLDGGEGGVRVSGWSVGPRACMVPRLRTVEFPVCGEVMFGELLGRPFGLANERFTRSLWATAGVGVGAWWPATEHIAIGADAIGFVAFRRPAFDTLEGTEIVRAAPAGFALVAGAEVRFGGER
jgi:hypothetical protein